MKRVLILVLTFVLVLSCAGCSKKTPQTLKGFQTVMEKEGFEVMDATDRIDTDGVEVTVYAAEKGDCEILFFCFEKESKAQKTFENCKASLEDMSSTLSSSVSVPGFSKHEQTSDGIFFYAARIENTMIYCEADKDEKSFVKDLMEELGYK